MTGLPTGWYRVQRDENRNYPDSVYERVAERLENALYSGGSYELTRMPSDVFDTPCAGFFRRRFRTLVTGFSIRVWAGNAAKAAPVVRYLDFPPNREHAIERTASSMRGRYVPAWAVRSAVESSSAKPARAISRFMYQTFGFNLDQWDMQHIGAEFSNTLSGSFDLHITTGADGRREEYFNERSCWWTDYPDSRAYLTNSGGGAVRAYQNGTLIGRVWWLPYDGEALTNGAVLFNAYGVDVLEHIDVWGTVVAEALGLKTARTHLYTNVGQDQMYVNSKTSVFVGHVSRQPRDGARFAVQLDLTGPDGDTESRLDYLLRTWAYCCDCDGRIPNIENRCLRTNEMLYCPTCAAERGLVRITAGAQAGWWAPEPAITRLDGQVYLYDDEHVIEEEGA